MADIYRGDDLNFAAVLKKDGNTFEIHTTAEVKANFIEKKTGLKMLSSPITVSRITSGSDWDESRVIVSVDAETSALLTPGHAIMEIQVNDAVNTEGKLTWRKHVVILPDVIP